MFDDLNEFAGWIAKERELHERASVPVPGAQIRPLAGPDGPANIAALPDMALIASYRILLALTEAERARCTYDVDALIADLIAELNRRNLPY